jgi:excisionase family DNA binding protein
MSSIIESIKKKLAAGMDDVLTLTVPEVATLLSCGKSSVYQLMELGDLPARKVGGSKRVLIRDYKRYVSGSRVDDLAYKPPAPRRRVRSRGVE